MKALIIIILSTIVLCSCGKKNDLPESKSGMYFDTRIDVQIKDSSGKNLLKPMILNPADINAYADASMDTILNEFKPSIDTLQSGDMLLRFEGCDVCFEKDTLCRQEYYVSLCLGDIDTVITESRFFYTRTVNVNGINHYSDGSVFISFFAFNGDTLMYDSKPYKDTLNPLTIIKNGCK